MREGECVLGVRHPSESGAAAAALQLDGIRTMIPGGKGKWWAVLPRSGWEEKASALLSKGFKLVTHSGPWTPESVNNDTPPKIKIHNIPCDIPPSFFTHTLHKTQFKKSSLNSEPHTYTISIFTFPPENLIDVFLNKTKTLNPESGWVENLSGPPVEDEEWPWVLPCVNK